MTTAMNVDLAAILSKNGQTVVDKIRNNLAATGTNASGKTSRSLRYEVTVSGSVTTLRVLGRPFFMTVETGRGPTKRGNTGGPTLVQSIREWMNSIGLLASPYGIARSIHKHGTKLYRAGGRKDIVSNVVNKSLTDRISEEVLAQFANAYIKVLKP